ncbi:MAG: DUF423 domain-containing protein [Aquimonas sp.]|nr:DUF423 domain-containing protein [Aquimonas sp.]
MAIRWAIKGALATRMLGGIGGLACAAAVALGAYASHAADGRTQGWLQTASLYLLLHGLALLILPVLRTSRLARAGQGLILAGMLLFCGSLIGAAIFGWSTRLAPFGGMGLILAWLLLAVDALRAPSSQR